jgi:hypothetical protein
MFDPDREARGWDGAQYGIILLVVIGIVKVWPFPAIALVGAAIGVLVGSALRRQASITAADRRGGVQLNVSGLYSEKRDNDIS